MVETTRAATSGADADERKRSEMWTRWISLGVVAMVAACNSPGAPTPERADVKREAAAPAAPAVAAIAATSEAAPSQSGAGATSAALVVVRDRSHVCMVNDHDMGREQIPVTVGDKTYFGCCPMCKGKLERDPAVRTARDPVSGRAVDKATAVIARAPSGAVLYFESEDTLARYRL